jgi:WD40 repeat protein/serine/threonine protein kinase
MSVEHERLKDVLATAAAKATAAERAAYLDTACQGNPGLRQQVEALLAAHDQAGDFLEKTVQIPPPDFVIERPGMRIGRYKLLERIGEGGFGVVFMAEQTEPVHRKIALKIIKAGMDTREVIARFEAERQALALMDHPNIAKILDAGTTGGGKSEIENRKSEILYGRPYFVMELVKGLPITGYCDQFNLSTHERLHLFMQVCQAVQHAHQKGIIHRDLKPSNILVTVIDGKPVPKIIDFGVAKALGQRLTERTLFTAFAQIVGTPAYMSPEQAALSGMDIDTRSDIYALGVLLYELLTGATPFDTETLHRAALEEIRRLIREVEPPKPSTRLRTLGDKLTAVAQHRQIEPAALTRLLHGDLDWIVMKALEKDRARRYETANSLAEDLQHHLNHEPVKAGPPGPVYRARKFVRRHRTGVILAASVSVALIAGLVASLIGFREARLERDHALTAERQAEQERDRALAAEAEAEKQQARAELMARQEAAHRERAEQTVMRMERQRAEDAFDEDNPSLGLAYLAWVLRRDPTNDAVAERILSALTYRNFPLPRFDPLQHGDAVNSALFSARGDRIVTASADQTARVWDAVTGQPVTEPLAHEDPVSYAEFCPDGQRVLTVSSNVCRLWDARSGWDSSVSISHQNLICAARFSPDGKKVVTASVDRTARISDAETGQTLVGPLQHRYRVSAAEFSPDGRTIMTASWDNTARIWDAQTGQPLTESLVHDGPVRFACFSADGKWLLTTAHQSARIWDVATGRLVGKPFTHLGGFNPVFHAQLSPGGRRVVTASGDSTARIWDISSGKQIGPGLRQSGFVTFAEFSPDGWTVAAASNDHLVKLWKTEVGELATARIQHEGAVVSARFSLDGRTVLAASADHTASLWSTGDGVALPIMLEHPGAYRFAEFSPDGRRVVTAACAPERTVRVWDTQTGAPVGQPLRHPRGFGWARFSSDGRLLVTTAWDSPTAQVWDARTGEPVTGPLTHPMREIQSLRFSPDGERVVTGGGGQDNSARIWSITGGGQLLHTLKHRNTVWEAVFHHDNRRVLTASADGTALVWDGDTGQPLIKPLRHEDQIYKAQFSPEGRRILTASLDGTARIWDATTGEPLAKPMCHSSRVWSAEFSPNGRWVATASSDNTARVWDAHTGEPHTAPLRHNDVVRIVHFSQDSRRLLTGSDAAAARVWDVRTGLPVSEPLRAIGGLWSAEFSPDGQRVLTGSGSPKRIWDVPRTPLPIPQWLPLLAEAVGRQCLTELGALEFVPVTNLVALRRLILAGNPDDFYTRWARWFFADRTARTISPFSSIPITNSAHWIVGQAKFPEAAALRGEPVERGNVGALNNIAWTMATSADPKVRDGQSAVDYAERVVAATLRASAMYLDTLAAAYAEAGQFTNALKVQNEALALLQNEGWKEECAARLKLYAAGLPYRDDGSLAQQASALLDVGKFADAEAVARECLALRERQIPDDWLTFNTRSLLGGSLLGQKKYAEAEPLLLSGYEGMKQREATIPSTGKANLPETLQRLVQLYEATDRPAQAAEWKQKLAEFEKGESEKPATPPP